MRRFLVLVTGLLPALPLVSGLIAPMAALAQPPEGEPTEEVGEEPAEGVEEAPAEEDDWGDDDWGEEEEPRLRAPEAQNLQLGDLEEAEGAAEEEEEEPLDEEEEEPAEDELPSPADAASRLDAGAPAETSDPTVSRWTTPQTVVDLHGYLRFRGNWQDNFFVNRILNEGMPSGSTTYNRGDMELPFSIWRPAEDGRAPAGGCSGEERCDQHALAHANMRLRLEPSIHLSDDVRVHVQVDVFDNMVLGSTPNALAVGPRMLDGGIIDPWYRYERTTMAPIDTASTTLEPPTYGLNSLQDSIRARRAWAEVRNRGLGELRFGRMGDHWGLGMIANGGSGIDSDYQTDVDRIMLITRLAGIYIFGAWDFASEGLLYGEPADLGGVAFDRSRLDDTDQFVVGAAYRATDEERTAALQRGDAVFNIGARFMYRSQNLSSYGTTNPFGLCVVCDDTTLTEEGRRFDEPTFVRRGADVYVPDLWVQFLYEKLRLEVEAAMVIGTIDNLSNTEYASPDDAPAANLLQFGIAFEGEYHLLNDQLGIYFAAGYASGDADVEGLTTFGGLPQQLPTGAANARDDTYSTFRFHPNYRVDLIFWRNVMRQVGGAYYFKPGLSYDFIRNSFGQLLGARADVIWSRASQPLQTWGNSDDLGVEINVSVYYRSEDGPDLLDGFYASAQWGLFFPLDGLGWPTGTTNNGTMELPSLGNAQTLRLILGVQY